MAERSDRKHSGQPRRGPRRRSHQRSRVARSDRLRHPRTERFNQHHQERLVTDPHSPNGSTLVTNVYILAVYHCEAYHNWHLCLYGMLLLGSTPVHRGAMPSMRFGVPQVEQWVRVQHESGNSERCEWFCRCVCEAFHVRHRILWPCTSSRIAA